MKAAIKCYGNALVLQVMSNSWQRTLRHASTIRWIDFKTNSLADNDIMTYFQCREKDPSQRGYISYLVCILSDL